MRGICRDMVLTGALMLMLLSVLLPENAAARQPIKRKVSPVETPATVTRARNEVMTDSARVNEIRRKRSVHYHDDEGNVVYVDTVTGEHWADTLAMQASIPAMEYPLVFSASAGVNLWDAAMRAFGQDYGIGSVWAEFNMHNRYIPRLEIGLGSADHWPDSRKFHYKSGVAPFFKIGCDYNFLYNSNPDYRLYGGLAYGLSSFSYDIDNVTLDSPYWDESVGFSLPRQRATVGWFEISGGVRVKLAGPVSAGWRLIFHSILHEGDARYGKPWYIPGFGSRKSSITGEFSISYTLSLNKKRVAAVEHSDRPESMASAAGEHGGTDMAPKPGE